MTAERIELALKQRALEIVKQYRVSFAEAWAIAVNEAKKASRD